MVVVVVEVVSVHSIEEEDDVEHVEHVDDGAHIVLGFFVVVEIEGLFVRGKVSYENSQLEDTYCDLMGVITSKEIAVTIFFTVGVLGLHFLANSLPTFH